MFAYQDQPFVITSITSYGRRIQIEAWHLPPRDGTTSPPLRLRYLTVPVGGHRFLLDMVQFGDLLVRTGEREILLQPVDGKGKETKRAAVLKLESEPEHLGTITSK